MLSAGQGEERQSYGRLAIWLGELGYVYAAALEYLAEVLGTEGDVIGRLTSAFQQIPLDPGGS